MLVLKGKMYIFKDYFGHEIKLELETWKEIQEKHRELIGKIDRVKETLSNPYKVIKSIKMPNVNLFYRYYKFGPPDEGKSWKKYLCVVVKAVFSENIISTAYVTDKIKRGELIWGK